MRLLSRKDFLTHSALFTGGTFLLGSMQACSSSDVNNHQIGLQLYTLRNQIEEQGIANILKKVAAIGYNEVETFGYSNDGIFGVSPGEFKKMCDDNGLNIASGHYLTGRHDASMTGTLKNGWKQAIEDAITMDQKNMVIAWLHPSERESLEQYKELTDMLNNAGSECAKAGIQFAYHNHDFEFEEMANTVPYDLLLEQTDEENVKMELDLYWIVKAGHDPVSYFKKHNGRFPLWHVKDMDEETGNFTEVGNGVIDFEEIFGARKKAGLEHYFVEQDVSDHPLKSIEISYGNVKKLI